MSNTELGAALGSIIDHIFTARHDLIVLLGRFFREHEAGNSAKAAETMGRLAEHLKH